ncbi:MAG: DNA/RNA non-specific endonuclease, partial [Thermosynechococcaceae cyanobacterium]
MNPFFVRIRLPIGLLLAVLCWSCSLWSPLAPANESIHLLLGNPSHAARLDSQRYKLFLRPQYALLYDRTAHYAAWASWQLNADWLGHRDRPAFTPDPDLPMGWGPVTPHDYTNSGFDRGHLVPAADRNKTPADLAAVFYMTNIVPQAPDNNRGPWEALESDCRDWVRAGQELY